MMYSLGSELPFLRPIKSLLLDESMSEIMGTPDATWWYERDGIIHRDSVIHFDIGTLRTGLEVVANHLGKGPDEAPRGANLYPLLEKPCNT